MKNNKKILFTSFTTILSMFPLVFLSSSLSINNNNITIVNNSQKIEIGEETTTYVGWKYNISNDQNNTNSPDVDKFKKNIPWFGKKLPKDINETLIKELLKIGNDTAKISIEIKPIEEKHNVDGYVEFNVIQSKTIFDNDNVTTSEKKVYFKPDGSNNSAYDKQDDTSFKNFPWSTKEITGLLISSKFNFEWRDIDEISSFLKTTKKNANELVINDVLTNMVKQGDGNTLPNGLSLSIEGITKNKEIDFKNGSAKIKINLPTSGLGSTDSEWLGGKKPSDDILTREVRGLSSTDVSISKEETSMVPTFISDIDNNSHQLLERELDETLKKQYLNTNEKNVKDLFASELANVNNKFNDSNLLNDILINSKYIKNDSTNNKNAVEIRYYGKNVSDSDFESITGLSKDIIDEIGFGNISAIAEDTIVNDNIDEKSLKNNYGGSLKITYPIKYYDVYRNEIVEEKFVKKITGFKINPDANKSLNFDWKKEINDINSSFNLVNDFEKNKDNPEYIKSLSNQLFVATPDVYVKDRKVEISYQDGNKLVNDEVVPINDSSIDSKKKVNVKLTFDTWNGAMNSDNTEGLIATQSFILPNYQSSMSIKWKTQLEMEETFSSKYGSLKNHSVNDISRKIYNKEIPLSLFVEGADSYVNTIIVNALTGTIKISITDNNGNIDSKVFTGFQTSSNNTNITQLTWLPEDQIPKELLVKDIETISKKDIIDQYLSKIPELENIVENDVIIEPNKENRTILVTVNVNKFNQNIETNEQFKVLLRGFINSKVEDANSYKTPLNLTIPLSITFASLISITLLIILIRLIVKRVKLNQSKKK